MAPEGLLAHNQKSWDILRQLIDARGQVEFQELVEAVHEHPHGAASTVTPQRFVAHCIGHGWLERKR